VSEQRLFNRKEAAVYMGRSLRKFDEIKHLFKVAEPDGTIRYDRELIDRYVTLNRVAA
jgi:hypothetical protein